MDETELRGKLAFANAVTIYDISLGGISLRTDRRIDIGKEYLLKLQYKTTEISVKGVVVWSVLSQSQTDSQGNIIPIYSCGLKFNLSSTDEIKQCIDLIEKQSKADNEQRGINLQTNGSRDLSVQFQEVPEVFQ
jgi:Tfp pilus assembly protein PilZ